MDKILVLDFGSSTAAQAAQCVRELGVYCELVPGETPLTDELLGKAGGTGSHTVKGIILSGSLNSVYSKEGLKPDPRLYTCGLPILGICYGHQRINYDNGGKVEATGERELGLVEVKGNFPAPTESFADPECTRRFFAAFDPGISLKAIKEGAATSSSGEWRLNTWMRHNDALTSIAPGFRQYGVSAGGWSSVIVHESKPWFGLQFHAEDPRNERRLEIFAAFVMGVSRCTPFWIAEKFAEEARSYIIGKVGKNPVLLLISGGVDSTVVAALLLKALDPDQVHLMYMDTGLMRKDETKSVKASLERLGARHITILNCENEFLGALKGITDPEAKRRAIGDLFISRQERVTARLGLPESCFLAQGTIYPDVLESGKEDGKNAKLVKSHHNVGSPLVDAKRKAGLVVEPLEKLYKYQVRDLGRFIGVDEEVLKRHPFPGPGISVRILGEVTKERCDLLREADAIYIEELKKRNLYDEIWQAFAVLLPIRSTGVAAGERKYGSVLALRAINTTDAMTAEVYPFQTRDLLEISSRITSTIKEIGRVVYDISSKPPATIEWE